jgi:uncharacterized protein involved in exopolysaccharide biosynthesis
VSDIERLTLECQEWRVKVLEQMDEIGRLQRELDERTAAANIRMFDQNAEIERLKTDMDRRMKAYVESQEKDEAQIERLKAAAEQDAKTIGKLQFALHELELREVDAEAEEIIRRALEEMKCPTT